MPHSIKDFDQFSWQRVDLDELVARGMDPFQVIPAYTSDEIMNHMAQWFEGIEQVQDYHQARLECYRFPKTLIHVLRLWFAQTLIGTFEINRGRLHKGTDAKKWPTVADYHTMELEKIHMFLRSQIRQKKTRPTVFNE